MQRFLFVPMLTPDDGSTDGMLTAYPPGEHPRRRDLWDFLQGCLKRGERDIRALRRYMKGKPFAYIPWSDDAFFTHARREEHFSKIPASALRHSLVFFDPDNGFEVPSMTAGNGAKYLRYSELADVFSRMDNSSIAVVYQHLPRKNRDDFFAETPRRSARVSPPRRSSSSPTTRSPSSSSRSRPARRRPHARFWHHTPASTSFDSGRREGTSAEL